MSGLDITPRPGAGKQLITSYGDGGFKISGKRYEGSLLVFPNRTIPWPVVTLGDVSLDSLMPVTRTEEGVRLLIVGCGRQFSPTPLAMQQALFKLGVALEWMDTGAACRTYNVLVLEGREVAAALLAVN